MTKISVSEIISVPIEVVFQYSVEYEKRMLWDTFSKKMIFLDGARDVQVGGRSRTFTHYGFSMDTEYVSRKDPFVYAVKMTRGPFFIKSFAGSWTYEALSSTSTRVAFIYNIQTRPRLIQPVFDYIYKKEMLRRLKAMKVYLEDIS